jgi:NTE family protein
MPLGYPFIFRPVMDGSGAYLIDGGLCSNLPVFLFDRERQTDRLPVVAFDLMTAPRAQPSKYSFGDFCGEMIEAALEAGDYLMRRTLGNIHHVQVTVPASISTLDFDLTQEQSDVLFNAGVAAAHSYSSAVVPQWTQARSIAEMLQARTGVPSRLMSSVLRSVARDFEETTQARGVRANIMLPTPSQTRIVVYQFGMDTDPDSDLELDVEAGCSGLSWRKRVPMAADSERARDSFANEWKMTRDQQNKIRLDRKAMFSFPMFELASGTSADVASLRLLGTLSVDSSTPLPETGWLDTHSEQALDIGKRWADVCSRLLS